MSDERDELDLGDGHKLVFSEYQGEKRVGANIIHPRPDTGAECQGWVSLEGRAWDRAFSGGVTSWKVESDEPLTLSPSVLCRSCGDHGYVRDGKWVRA